MNFVEKILKRYKFKELLFEFVIFLIGYPIYALSHLIPRDKNKWVIGNKDAFSDNGKYFYIYLLENTNINVFWITSSRQTEKQLKEKGLPVCYKYSFRGLYHLLTAYVYICTVTTNFISFWTSGGVRKVNLWHGVGIKALNKKSSSLRDHSFVSRILIPYGYETYNLFLSTSKLMNEHFSNCFSSSKQNIFEGIYPRCSFLMENGDKMKSILERYESLDTLELIDKMQQYDRVYIYMPTWRLIYGGNFLDYALPDMNKLNAVLKETNSLLLLKLHPAIKYNNDRNFLEHILYIDASMDVYPLLPYSDILITDYSSIYYDYILMDNKGCILYEFDYESYILNEYEFILDFNEYTPGVHVKKFCELLEVISRKEQCLIERRNWILSTFWGDYKLKDMNSLASAIAQL